MKHIKQTGSALISALLIVTIVAALATMMAVQERVNIREVELITSSNRAYLELQGVQAWAVAELTAAINNNTPEVFPKIMPKIDFNGDKISGVIEDQMGLFNINSLTNPNNQSQFIHLLQITNPTLSTNQAFSIANAITNWLSASNADEIYMRKNPAYRAAHQIMANKSELRLVDGISNETYLQLAPFITALPIPDNKININSAPIPIIMSLADNMTPSQAESILACRMQHRQFTDIQDFLTSCVVKLGIQLNPNVNLITSSSYFLTKGTVTISQRNFVLSTLLQRSLTMTNNQKKINVLMLWQSWDEK